MEINIQDFCYIRRGKKQKETSIKDIEFLQPVHHTGSKNNSVILLIHGFASSPAVYRELIPQLQNYDAIICPALPGHARNMEAFSLVKAKEWVNAVEIIFDELEDQYQHVDVLGLSLGGLLACHLAKTRSIRHLILLAPALALHQNISLTLPLTKLFKFLGLKSIPNYGGDIELKTAAELTFKKLPITTIYEILNLIHTFHYDQLNAEQIDLFLGRHDQVVNVQEVEKRLALIPSINTHWLEQSAHVLPLDFDKKIIIDCINQYGNKT